MRIRVYLRQILLVVLSSLYLASATPLAFAAINLDAGHSHSIKFSFDDGHMDLIFGHEGDSPEDQDSKPLHDHDHKVHIQEELSRYSSAEAYTAPELTLASDALSILVLTLLPEVKVTIVNECLSSSHEPGWVKLRTVMLV